MEKSIIIDGHTFTKDNIKVVSRANSDLYKHDKAYEYLYINIVDKERGIAISNFMYKNEDLVETVFMLTSDYPTDYFDD